MAARCRGGGLGLLFAPSAAAASRLKRSSCSRRLASSSASVSSKSFSHDGWVTR